MIELTREQAPVLEALFRDEDDSPVWSYLQGHMGRGWADRLTEPACGKITVADFTYFAGDASRPEAEEMARDITRFEICTAREDGWYALLERVHGEKCLRSKRYAIQKEGDVFDRVKLRALVDSVAGGYEIRRMDRELCEQALETPGTRDLCGNFDSIDDYLARGYGFGAVKDGKLVCGASSYTVYDEGLEIEIVTLEEHRRKGLATACAATLILGCLERGWYPCWDAANPESAALAQTLGYRYLGEYDVCWINPTEGI